MTRIFLSSFLFRFPPCVRVSPWWNLLSYPRIRQRVEEIREEVHGHVGKADHENAALDEVIVAAADGADSEASDAGPGKNCFGNDCAREQRSELKSHHGEHRNQSVTQRMLVYDDIF
jgi:hypothetical protein